MSSAQPEEPDLTSPPPPIRASKGISPSLTIIWRRKRIIAFATVAGLVIGVVWATFVGREYTATASFVVQSRRDLAGLSGIAAQFGFQLPSASAAQSPQFYSDLLGTSSLLARLATCPVKDRDHPVPRALSEVIMPKVEPELTRQERMIRWLRRRLITGPNTRSSVVGLKFAHRDPLVAAGVLDCALNLVDDYNKRIRHSNASAERRFAEARVVEAEDSLRGAENELQSFLERNRADPSSAPPLKFRQDRLMRRQQERQEVVGALKQMLEQSRLEEVRDTPVITIVEPPRVPALPDAGTRSRVGIVGAIVGLTLACLWMLFSDAWPRLRARFEDETRSVA